MKKGTIIFVSVAISFLISCGSNNKYFHLGNNPPQGPMSAKACEDLVKMAKETGSAVARCSDTP
jgi:hypothetical protein